MSITVAIVDGPLGAGNAQLADGAGAVICFEGLVRPMEDGEPIDALTYETYDPMAQQTLRQLACQVHEQFALLAIHVMHSRGRVPVGACSFRLQVAARHRREGIAALSHFIDTMKQDVPIWKRPVYRLPPEERS
jgi:molybdopterin synthase catalytic subunit